MDPDTKFGDALKNFAPVSRAIWRTSMEPSDARLLSATMGGSRRLQAIGVMPLQPARS